MAIEDDEKIILGGPNCPSRRVIKLDMSKLLAFDEVTLCLDILEMIYMLRETIIMKYYTT